MTAAVLVSLFVAAGIAGWFFRPRHDAYLSDRLPDLARWQQLYSPSELSAVMDVLDTLRLAFLLGESDVYRLLPHDRLLDLYCAAYPHGGADAMEFEELFLMLSRRHHVPDDELDRLQSLTVDDIIRLCLSHANNGT